MADDIKIRVGVSNNVKAGMDGVVSDVRKGAQKAQGGFGGMRGILGGIGVTAAVAGVRKLIASVDDLGDQAEQVDFSPANYQKLRAVAEDAGIGADKLGSALGRMNKAQAEIATDKKLQQAFSALGISVDDVIKARPDQLFEMIAAGLAKTGDRSAIFDILGRGASALIPTLAQVANGFDKVKVSSAGIISDKDIEAIDKADKKLNALGRTLQVFGAKAIGGAITGIETFFGRLGAISGGGSPLDYDRMIAEEDARAKAEKAASDEARRKAEQERQMRNLETQRKIDPLEAANKTLKSEQSDIKRADEDRRERADRLKREVDDAAVRQNLEGRLMGRGDRDQQANADYQSKRALDSTFDRQERDADRQQSRAERRRALLVREASKALGRFMPNKTVLSDEEQSALMAKLPPRLRKILQAEKMQEKAARDKQNLEQLQRDAAQAQLDSVKLQQQIADNTDAIADLKQLLVVGGGN